MLNYTKAGNNIYRFRVEAADINAGAPILLNVPRERWNVLFGSVRCYNIANPFTATDITLRDGTGARLLGNSSANCSGLNAGSMLSPSQNYFYNTNGKENLFIFFEGVTAAGDGYVDLTLFMFP